MSPCCQFFHACSSWLTLVVSSANAARLAPPTRSLRPCPRGSGPSTAGRRTTRLREGRVPPRRGPVGPSTLKPVTATRTLLARQYRRGQPLLPLRNRSKQTPRLRPARRRHRFTPLDPLRRHILALSLVFISRTSRISQPNSRRRRRRRRSPPGRMPIFLRTK